MIVTIRVEYEGSKPRYDLGLEEKITTEQIDSAKSDLVCDTFTNLRRMIQQALDEETNV